LDYLVVRHGFIKKLVKKNLIYLLHKLVESNKIKGIDFKQTGGYFVHIMKVLLIDKTILRVLCDWESGRYSGKKLDFHPIHPGSTPARVI